MVVAQGMAERFAGLPGRELVHGCWATKNSPLGVGEMRLVGRCVESEYHCQCKAWIAWCQPQASQSEGLQSHRATLHAEQAAGTAALNVSSHSLQQE